MHVQLAPEQRWQRRWRGRCAPNRPDLRSSGCGPTGSSAPHTGCVCPVGWGVLSPGMGTGAQPNPLPASRHPTSTSHAGAPFQQAWSSSPPPPHPPVSHSVVCEQYIPPHPPRGAAYSRPPRPLCVVGWRPPATCAGFRPFMIRGVGPHALPLLLCYGREHPPAQAWMHAPHPRPSPRTSKCCAGVHGGNGMAWNPDRVMAFECAGLGERGAPPGCAARFMCRLGVACIVLVYGCMQPLRRACARRVLAVAECRRLHSGCSQRTLHGRTHLALRLR